MENRCPRLSVAGYEEVDARVQLLLKSADSEHTLPAVVCDERGARVEWEGQRFAITGRASIEDEVVDIIEGQLHGAQRRAEADPRSLEAAAVEQGTPVLERGSGAAPTPPLASVPADPRAARAADARGGGILVGLELEAHPKDIGVVVGPSFDFGAPLGPLFIGGHEAFRVGGSEPTLVLMDFQASLGVGAPYDPSALFGAVVRAGGEWLVAYPEGNSGQTTAVGMIDLGARFAYAFRSFSIWAGLDAHFRTSTLSLRTPERHIIANDVTGSLSLGLAYIDWSRK